MKRRLVSLLVALMMLSGVTVFATDAPINAPPAPSAWAMKELVEAEAYSLVTSTSYLYYLHETVTQDDLNHMMNALGAKLALIGLEAGNTDTSELTYNLTRQGVMNALYKEAAAYDLPGIEAGAVDYLREIGVVKGDGTGLALDRACTLQEAICMAQRLLTNIYDQCAAGAAGLLWKVTNGTNTLYLLGTVHVDRGNIYPFDHSLRAALDSADAVYFEIDFGDEAGIMEFAALAVYSDGTTLKDHVSEETYEYAVEIGALVGLDEAIVAMCKPWYLANTFTSMLSADESAGTVPMPMDQYIYSRALVNGQEIGQVESYGFQGQLFDSLSPEYQEAYLYSSIMLVDGLLNGVEEDDESLAATAEYEAMLDAYIEAWKTRDVEGFDASYGKDEIMQSEDELNIKLFIDRDPAMIEAANGFLTLEGENTIVLVVGAGHMVGEIGIVQGLTDLGYTVEVVPVG